MIVVVGTASAMFLIFNRVIGTGIFATPSVILSSAGGSVGVSFLMWIAGALVAFAGTAVYIELGSVRHDLALLALHVN